MSAGLFLFVPKPRRRAGKQRRGGERQLAMKILSPYCLALSLVAIPALAAPAAPKGVFSYTVPDIAGKPVPLSKYAGKVVMIVNTASLCGNTPQYKSLEALYEKYQSRGLRILAFPANDFAFQEPGSNAGIYQFCTQKYQTSFDLFSKLSVKAPHQSPLYAFLTSKQTDPQFGGDIEWNFAKFLIGRNGQVVARFPAGHNPLSPDVVAAVEREMNKPAR